ncbi:MAG TPA: S41 family peptidase [Vicinamibacterales bacterium]|jgi:C-terminal processing protease CtpA/Prc
MSIVMRVLLLAACVPLGFFVYGQPAQPPVGGGRPEFAGLLDFEAEHSGGVPKGWTGGPPDTIAVDGQVVHGGKWSLRIERKPESANSFTALTKVIPIDFAGAALELRGFLRTDSVSEFAGLWMRQDDDNGSVAFDNMQSRQLKGTTDWTEYTITLPLNKGAKRLVFGVLAAGTGKVWADDLRLLLDGKPIETVPRVEIPKTVVDLDHEFDAGSKIVLKTPTLTKTQIANLAMLGKVWGFVKYHHPLVTGGKRHWDYELFRVLPLVLNAADERSARSAVQQWITGLGAVPACAPCTSLAETDLHLRPPVTWLTDAALGAELAATLRDIHRNRPSAARQFYVSLVPNIGNPSFDNELAYANVRFPDAGYQLLALYRFWNIVEYWFPYRDVIGADWNDALIAFIPRIALANDGDTYKRELMALIASVHDTHANLWSSLDVRPPAGACRLPVLVRFIENQPVVAGYTDPASGAASGLQVGDVIASIDGAPVTELVERWTPYYAASNEPTRLRDIGQFMTRGACGAAAVRIERAGATLDLKLERGPQQQSNAAAGRTHDRPGDTFRKLSPDVAYLKLSSVQASQAAKYIESAAGTKGLVIDIRNYPSEFVVFALGSRLVDRPTEFARFTAGDPANPGAFHWRGAPLSLQPEKPTYAGKVVILIDEVSVSQAEYTTMAFRSARNATVVGSTTAGADGNVSGIALPGGLRSMISGIGVFYPDKKPTQRIGIIPDVEVRPTIQGIRSGRDEVLERALRLILGPDTPASEIERLAKS